MEGIPPPSTNNEENRPPNESGFFFNIFRRAPLFGPIFALRDLTSGRNSEREEGGFFGRTSSIRIISSTYSNSERNLEYAPQPNINPDEIREAIAQNLLEVQNIIDYGNYNEFTEDKVEEKDIRKNINDNDVEMKNEKEAFNMNCFDLNKRVLVKGQWVDVKDTVEQWLDAQVIEVSDDNTMVKIHYNHWSTRWDEWIKTNSPRIMPFRYHTRQSILSNYHSPFPNKKPDMGITLLSFENLNKNSCVNPSYLTQPRIRTSTVISNTINNNTNNSRQESSSNNNNDSNTNNNEQNQNNNRNMARRTGRGRYADPPVPIPSPKHLEPDPENHIIKNLGEDGFLGVFKEFNQINKVINGLSSELINEYNYNTEILTPKKLSEIQNKSYYNLKRLIPILDRTGRIYSDISTFMEHTMRSNQLELLSKNLFADASRINEDLKNFSTIERRRISQEILSKNSNRENRSGTLNFVPPVNNFETKLVNSIPILDTPYMIKKNDHSPQIYDFVLQNNNEEETDLNVEENNNNNNNNNEREQSRNNTNNSNGNSNNNFSISSVERFNLLCDGGNEVKDVKNKSKKRNKKKNKNGYKMLGIKTKREKNKNKDEEKDKEK